MANTLNGNSKQVALVTGSSGFIGSHLISRLSKAGWEVHVLQREHSSVEAIRASEVAEVHLYRGNTEEVMQAMMSCQPVVVFHLASLFLASHMPQQVAPLIEANVLLGAQLLEAMAAAGVTSLVNTGTSWQYFHSSEFNPVNLYAATKKAFEDILMYYVSALRMRAVTLILFDSYGPRDTRKKLLRLLVDCFQTGDGLQMSGGEQMLDLVHIDDICSAFLRAADLVRDPSQPAYASYAVSGNQRRSLRNVVATLESVAGKQLNIEFGARPYREREVMELWDGPQLPGWAPEVALEDGFLALLREASA